MDNLLPRLEATLQDKIKFKSSWRAQWKIFASGNFVADGETRTSPGRSEKFYLDLPEAFVERKRGEQKFRAGFNTVNWGLVDLSSPMDTVNTVALFHPLHSIKQGAPMLEWLWTSDTFEVDALYIPWQTRPRLPDADSRWLPRSVLLNLRADRYRIVLPKKIAYRTLKPETIDHALSHNAGVKLTLHWGRLDLHASHFEGAGSVAKARPTVELDTSIASDDLYALSPIGLAPLTYRVRTSGLGFVWATDSWIFKNENVYQSAVGQDPLVQPWMWQHVLAAETSSEIGGRNLTTILQFYKATSSFRADNTTSNYFRLFDQTPVLAMRLASSDTLTWLGSALYESNTRGWFFILGFEHKLKDALSWKLSWTNFSAPREGLLKTYDKNDHATLEMTYFF